MDEKKAVTLLGEAFRSEPIESESAYTFILRSSPGGLEVSVDKARLQEVISTLNSKSQYGSLWIHDEFTMEILAREESTSPVRTLRGEVSLLDEDNGVRYEITSPSDEYLLFFLEVISGHPDAGFLLRRHVSIMLERRLTERLNPPSVFDALRISFLRITTVKITCNAKTSAIQMSALANAFLFQVAFNTDIALVPQKEIDSVSRSGRISRMRRNRPSEIDPPRRLYNEDLIHHYLMAISTDNPFVEYLSYYHVLEHFYEAVFQDDLISSIQGRLTDPAFSYRRKKDIKTLIKTIRQSLKIQNDTITFSEEEALRLTLTRFVDISDLANDLNQYDPTLLDYYRDSKVGFASAMELDLRSGDSSGIYKSLSKRIYATRNALVHSKDGDRAKYTPFVDDHTLTKELPLLRFISEKTILRNSSIIE